jgi:hypothetical protein
MSQLMVVPIRDKGDCVLIVGFHDGEPLMGYVTKDTLDHYFQDDLTICEYFRLVRSNLESFETKLAVKSENTRRSQGPFACLEMTLSDLQ